MHRLARLPLDRLLAWILAGLALATAISAVADPQDLVDLPHRPRVEFKGVPSLAVTPESLQRLLFPPVLMKWSPAVAGKVKSRGGADIYAKVAPNVVVVRSESGHGSGFIIDPAGWILTNHHVVADGLAHDDKGGGSYALVHLGSPGKDGTITLEPEPVRAFLYKHDMTRDLALLKIDPPVGRTLSAVGLSASAPRPGSTCAIVGHPAAGMLWLFRACEVAGVGQAPADLVDFVMARLAAHGADRTELLEALGAMPSRRIVLSSAGANPGDSGGPLVDAQGLLLGVTFGGPVNPEDRAVTLDKFTYHVHLDEVRAFLKDRPATPTFMFPSPWDAGPRAQLQDLDDDGKPDILVLGSERPDAVLFDIRNATPAAAVAGKVSKLVADHAWTFDAAIHSSEQPVAFYDSDSDGTLDLVLLGDESGRAEWRFSLDAQGRWRVAPGAGVSIVSARHLKNPAVARRFGQLYQRLIGQ